MKSGCLIINSYVSGRLWPIKYITELKLEKILWVNTIKNSTVGGRFML